MMIEWIKDNKIWSIPIGVLIFANLVLMFVDTSHEEINFDEYTQHAPMLELVNEPIEKSTFNDQHLGSTSPLSHKKPHAHDANKEIETRLSEHEEEDASNIRHPQDIAEGEAIPPWRLELVCYEVGPFLKMKELEDASAMIGTRAYTNILDDRTTKEAIGYWVFLPPERSRALSRLKVEELKEKGIKDVVLMRRSEPINSVSLGLYTKKHIAERRVDQIEKIGYKPKMEIRYKIEADIWLKSSIYKEKDFSDKEWQDLIKQFNNITVISGSC